MIKSKTLSIKSLAGALLAASLLTGAGMAAAMTPGTVTESALDRVQVGQSRADVIAQLGAPERIVSWPGSKSQTLFYSTDATPDYSLAVAHVDIGRDGKVQGVDVSQEAAEE
ncbi:MAG: hypothetical protein QM639_07405 [Rhodocyclaceae bacterium]